VLKINSFYRDGNNNEDHVESDDHNDDISNGDHTYGDDDGNNHDNGTDYNDDKFEIF